MRQTLPIKLLAAVFALCYAGMVCAQNKPISVDDVGLKLSGAENSIQQIPFRATVNGRWRTNDREPRSYYIDDLSIECDGKGNVRWKQIYRGVQTETLLVDSFVYQRINGGEWKDVTDDTGNQPSEMVWLRWRNFEEDTTFDYVVRLFPLFFERLKHVTVSRNDDIDGSSVTVFELSDVADGDTAKPKYGMEFWFGSDGKLLRMHSDRRSGIRRSGTDHYETDIEFAYDISIERSKSYKVRPRSGWRRIDTT